MLGERKEFDRKMDAEKRKSELKKFLSDAGLSSVKFSGLIEEMAFLEENLEKLRGMPFLRIHPGDPSRQKATPASKQYRELLSQYTAIVKTLARVSNDDGEEDSPLRQWFAKNVVKDGEKNDDV